MPVSPLPEPVLVDTEAVHGYLHRPADEPAGAALLAHGAGGDCNATVLPRVATTFAGHDLAPDRSEVAPLTVRAAAEQFRLPSR